jgi:hypothetical protein
MRNMPCVGVDSRNASSTIFGARPGSACKADHSSGFSASSRMVSVSSFVVVSLPATSSCWMMLSISGHVERPLVGHVGIVVVDAGVEQVRQQVVLRFGAATARVRMRSSAGTR